jgi:glycosyltransferase involved in cell wall biosynthesis
VVCLVQNLSVPQDRRVWREASTLRAGGYDVAVICPGGPGLRRRERLDGVEILRYPPTVALPGLAGHVVETAWTLAWTALLLVVLHRRRPIDVIHAANPPDTYVVIGTVARRLGMRFVYDQHDLCPELLEAQAGAGSRRTRLLRPLLLRLERWSYRRADLVIAPNNSYRRVALARGGLRPEAVVVVRSGADEALPPAPRRPGHPLVVAFAGVMNLQDRVDLLLRAAARVLARRPGSIRLELIGTGDDVPRLRALAERLGIESVVAWRGWLSGADLVDRLRSADIAVSLDDDNAFSRLSTMTKVPEYLALGLGCVLADLPENRVSAGDAAVYFAPGDATALAARLDSLLEDPARVGRLRRAAGARAPILLWEHGARRLLDAYAWLLDGAPAVAGDQRLAA